MSLAVEMSRSPWNHVFGPRYDEYDGISRTSCPIPVEFVELLK